MAKEQIEELNGTAEKKSDKYTWRRQLIRLPLLLLIPLGLYLPKLIKNDPAKVESVYSEKIYPVIARILGKISSFVPTSLAEILIIGLAVVLAVILVVRILRVPFGKLTNRRKNRMRLISYLISLGIFAGVMLNLFYCLWGFNHYRQSASELLGLEVRQRPTEDLAVLCERLATEAAELREEVAEDENGVFNAGSRQISFRSVASAYAALGRENALFSNTVYPAKSTFFSETLSKLDIAGIYIPYTAEANVNDEQPDLYVLSGAAHETAHYFGFAREDEANFLAFYVSCFSNDAALKYSSTMMALNYCANMLVGYDKEKYFDIRSRCYTEGMVRDLANYTAYFQKYENHPAKKVNNNINDAYLKYNGQDDGIQSYGRMVDLMLAFYLPDA